MTEETTKPDWKIPAILSVLLIAFMIGGAFVESVFIDRKMPELTVLWVMLKIGIAFVAYFSWNKQIKCISGMNSGKVEYFRGAIPALITALVVLAGRGVVSLLKPFVIVHEAGSQYFLDANLVLTYIFTYLTTLIILRGSSYLSSSYSTARNPIPRKGL